MDLVLGNALEQVCGNFHIFGLGLLFNSHLGFFHFLLLLLEIKTETMAGDGK